MKGILNKYGGKFILLAVLFILTACSAYDSEANKQAADKAVEQSEEIPAQAVQLEDTDKNNVRNFAPDKKELPKPFSENPYGMELYKAVLQEGAAFYSTYDQEYMTLNQFTQSHNGGQLKAEIPEFAVVDLDRDGQLEIILTLTKGINDIFVYEVLHCQNDIVYGYSLPYRSFMDLGTDGTFYGSSGTGWQNWGTIQFDADTYTIIEYAHTEIYYDPLGSKVSYYIGEENVTESVYHGRISEWRSDEEVSWFTFTDENLSPIFTE